MKDDRALIGRGAELAAIDDALGNAPGGPRRVVVEGEPGIGKTSVWREAIDRAAARGSLVLSRRPAQPESRLSFAGLGTCWARWRRLRTPACRPPGAARFAIALLRVEADDGALDPRPIGTAVISLLSALLV